MQRISPVKLHCHGAVFLRHMSRRGNHQRILIDGPNHTAANISGAFDLHRRLLEIPLYLLILSVAIIRFRSERRIARHLGIRIQLLFVSVSLCLRPGNRFRITTCSQHTGQNRYNQPHRKIYNLSAFLSFALQNYPFSHNMSLICV